MLIDTKINFLLSWFTRGGWSFYIHWMHPKWWYSTNKPARTDHSQVNNFLHCTYGSLSQPSSSSCLFCWIFFVVDRTALRSPKIHSLSEEQVHRQIEQLSIQKERLQSLSKGLIWNALSVTGGEMELRKLQNLGNKHVYVAQQPLHDQQSVCVCVF